jgi:RES domain-containing protein
LSDSHVVWRIAADTPDYASDDLSGMGAKDTGGRWNRKGTPMIYASESIALACLETLVHLGGADPLPLNRYLVSVSIPRTVWMARSRFDSANHVGWDALPAGMVSMDWGTYWSTNGQVLLAEVPSIVVPEEHNVLINPLHREIGKIKARKMRKWLFDGRFLPTTVRTTTVGNRMIKSRP